jgi:hypothetical protein
MKTRPAIQYKLLQDAVWAFSDIKSVLNRGLWGREYQCAV